MIQSSDQQDALESCSGQTPCRLPGSNLSGFPSYAQNNDQLNNSLSGSGFSTNQSYTSQVLNQQPGFITAPFSQFFNAGINQPGDSVTNMPVHILPGEIRPEVDYQSNRSTHLFDSKRMNLNKDVEGLVPVWVVTEAANNTQGEELEMYRILEREARSRQSTNSYPSSEISTTWENYFIIEGEFQPTSDTLQKEKTPPKAGRRKGPLASHSKRNARMVRDIRACWNCKILRISVGDGYYIIKMICTNKISVHRDRSAVDVKMQNHRQ